MRLFSLQLIFQTWRRKNPSWIPPGYLKMVLMMCVLVIFMSLCGCTTQSKETVSSTSPLTVACTIPPQEEFIRAVAGDYDVSVLVMVPPGASPHTFEPTPSQIAGLESADLYIAVGSGIEFENRWISRIQKLYPELLIVNASKTIMISSLSGHDHEGTLPASDESADPHVWLSLSNAAIIVNETCNAMIMKKPDMRDTFLANKDLYIYKLTDLDHLIHESLLHLQPRTVLVYHPAFGYFCREYNLTQMAVEENGREPSARKLAELITKAKNEGIKFVFTEPELSTRQAETLARELNGTMVLISPLAANYLENMQNIAQKISGGS